VLDSGTTFHLIYLRRSVTTFKILFPYFLTSFGLIVVTSFSAYFMMSNKIDDLRTWLALALTATFILCCCTTLSLIIGTANKTMEIDKDMIKWLGGASIAEVAGIVTIVFNFFFKSGDNTGKVEKIVKPPTPNGK
jgi:hypothetical protein